MASAQRIALVFVGVVCCSGFWDIFICWSLPKGQRTAVGIFFYILEADQIFSDEYLYRYTYRFYTS